MTSEADKLMASEKALHAASNLITSELAKVRRELRDIRDACPHSFESISYGGGREQRCVRCGFSQEE